MTSSQRAVALEFAYTRSEAVRPTVPGPGVVRKLGAFNRKFLVVENRLAANWAGKAHSHIHDQAVYIVSGHIRVTCQGRIVDMRAGDSFVVPSGVEHQVTAITEAVTVDVFSPCREEFLDGRDR
jgi:quercetin dioxygenase-like cupin family protein